MKKLIPKNSLELLGIKQARKNQLAKEYNDMVQNFVETKRQAMKEAGIPESEVMQWEIAADGKSFEKIEKPKPPKPTPKIPKHEEEK